MQAVELPPPEAVPDKEDVPPGDTVTFTVQVPWASSFFVAGAWRWVPDTTTDTSTIVGNPCGRQVTCKVVVRERGHVEVDDIRINGGGPQFTMGARSRIISIHPPQFTVTANPTSITSAQSVTFTASVNASIVWSISTWTWTPDSGTGGIAPNGCAPTEKVCTRTILKSGWIKAATTIGPYTLVDSAHVVVVPCPPGRVPLNLADVRQAVMDQYNQAHAAMEERVFAVFYSSGSGYVVESVPASATSCSAVYIPPQPGDHSGADLIAIGHAHPARPGETLTCPSQGTFVLGEGGSGPDWRSFRRRQADPVYQAAGWSDLQSWIIDGDNLYVLEPGQSEGSELRPGATEFPWNTSQCHW